MEEEDRVKMASEYPAEQDKEKPDLDIANEETAVWIAKDNSTGQNSHAEQTVSYGRSSEKPSEKRRKLYYEVSKRLNCS